MNARALAVLLLVSLAAPDAFGAGESPAAEGEADADAGGHAGDEAPAPAPDATAAAASLLAFADHLLLSNEPHRAVAEYRRYLFLCGDCPSAPHARLQLGRAWRRAGAPGDAARVFRALVEEHPDRPEAFLAARELGETLAGAGDPAGASDAFAALARRARAQAVPPGIDADAVAAAAQRDAVRAALRARDRVRVESTVTASGDAALQGLPTAASLRPSRRSPAVAAGMSAVLPGAGHVYAGRWQEGIAALVTNALFISATWLAWDREEYAVAGVLGAAEVFWYGGNVVGAANAARRYNEASAKRHWHGLEERWLPPPPTVSMSFRF